MSDCYQQVDDELGQPTFNKVGVVKRKIFVEQKLHEEVRKRVKNATETHEKERKSHKYIPHPVRFVPLPRQQQP